MAWRDIGWDRIGPDEFIFYSVQIDSLINIKWDTQLFTKNEEILYTQPTYYSLMYPNL